MLASLEALVLMLIDRTHCEGPRTRRWSRGGAGADQHSHYGGQRRFPWPAAPCRVYEPPAPGARRGSGWSHAREPVRECGFQGGGPGHACRRGGAALHGSRSLGSGRGPGYVSNRMGFGLTSSHTGLWLWLQNSQTLWSGRS